MTLAMKIFTLFITSLILFSQASFAQDMLISFSGTGDAFTVDSVTVLNVTRNMKITISGSAVLRLTGSPTGTEDIPAPDKGDVQFYPNPADKSTQMRFSTPFAGRTEIVVTDISGRRLASFDESLPSGDHLARIDGMPRGMSFVTIRNGNYTRTGRLMSTGQSGGSVKILYENQTVAENVKKDPDAKGAIVWMHYDPDDRLEMTGTSGECIALVSDIPTSSKTIVFTFRRCVDPDGNKYKTVNYGTLVWMAENLRTTKYSDGMSIRYVDDNPAEFAGINHEGACSFYNGDTSRYWQYYGGYYNFHAAATGKLCPTGWHVPSIDDYTNLKVLLILAGYNINNSRDIYSNLIAKALASHGNIYLYGVTAGPSIQWTQSEFNGTPGCGDYPTKMNATGFSAIPAGALDNLGFGGSGNSCSLWTSTSDGESGRFVQIRYDVSSFMMNSSTVTSTGMNVRCVKDNSR